MCHFFPRLRRVVPSRSIGPSRPTLSPMKRWSWSESPTTVHNLRSTSSSLLGPVNIYRVFSHIFRVSPGLGTLGTACGRLDPSLRGPRSPISHRAVVGASVPIPFSPSCRCRCPSGIHHLSRLTGSPDLFAASPTLSLVHRG
ncbi:hypothetical protein CRG98_038302 [Punica granatum]|uniref:Uncharacterized protein n=1 Tax=Punica granatum TaxID=22663 RepID=A0A2I0ID39_PUNGR|nr:hypothetical protein CRG98_038302 [Punica granatum]